MIELWAIVIGVKDGDVHGGRPAVLGHQLQHVGVLALLVQLLAQHQVSRVQLCTSTLKGLVRTTQNSDGAGEREAWPTTTQDSNGAGEREARPTVDQAGAVPCELLVATSGIPMADYASRVFKAKRGTNYQSFSSPSA